MNNEIITDTQQTTEQVKKGYHRAGIRELILFALLILPSFFSIDSLFHGNIQAGNAVSVFIMIVLMIVFSFPKRKKLTIYGAVAAIILAALPVSFMFHDNKFVKFLTICAIPVMTVIYFMEVFGYRTRESGTIGSVIDGFSVFGKKNLGSLSGGFYSIFSKKAGKNGSQSSFGAVIIGIVIALPFFGILFALLLSSDAAFSGMISKINGKTVREIIVSLMFGFPVLMLCYSLTAGASAEDNQIRGKSKGKLDKAPLIGFLGLISALFAVYIFSQLAYFVNAFKGFLPKNFTAAEYARKGFFESCAICVINLVIISVTSLLAKKNENGKIALPVRILNTFICIFSLFITGSAISKMIMYINRFGLTRLRIFTTVFMVVMGVLFIAIIARLYCTKVPYLKITSVAAGIAILIIAFGDINGFIANYNVDAYLDGRLKTVDVNEIKMLKSYSSVEPLIRLADCPDENVSKRAETALKFLDDILPEEDDGIFGFLGYNVRNSEGRQALDEWKEKLQVTINNEQ